ncbi:hypothetical protein [Thiofilum flexile]|uniref:hypothetical protein n=1 Tax=Thiofilum flexile TaxID=125627 RepID=UPI00036BC108|nr:hypothetical protein [Thiofilum flexile]
MNMSEVSIFVWSALSGGAFYDLVKKALGASYDNFISHIKFNNKMQFEKDLHDILEKNTQLTFLLETLMKTDKDKTVNKNINHGVIFSGGNVHLGDNISK